MGYIKQAETAAQRLTKQNATTSGVIRTKETEKLLQMFPILMRDKVLRQATRAAARIVANIARKNIANHRSRVTGTRDKWSKKVARQRGSHDIDLWQSIKVKTVAYDKKKGGVVISMAGPSYPHGNHAFLVEFGGFYRPLWGSDTVQENAEPMPFMRPAAHETVNQQGKALEDKVRKLWQKI